MIYIILGVELLIGLIAAVWAYGMSDVNIEQPGLKIVGKILSWYEFFNRWIKLFVICNILALILTAAILLIAKGCVS